MSHILERAQTFICNNARLLERRLFEHVFCSNSKHHVVSALRAYQNEDGGFGNALEPDKRTATSQPIDQEIALRVLDDVGFDPGIALSVCNFLQIITTAEGGVPFVLPSVRNAPCAPWWNTETDHPLASINPTASIAGLLHKHAVQHAWLDRATSFCWQHIEQHDIPNEHDVLCVLLFLEHVGDRERAERAFQHVSAQLLQGSHVTFDLDAEGYVFSPLAYVPSPHSLCRRLFDDATIAMHLDALAHKQQADGGWPIAWPAVSPACEFEYRGIVTLNTLKTLNAYGYLRENEPN